ncbi:MAG: site-specific integrase, partial [Pseudomonadota bacterium]
THVRQGITKLLKKGLKPQTTNRYKAGLSAVFSGYLDKDDCHKNPCRQVISKTEGDGRKRIFSNEERTNFLTACKTSQWEQLYLFALMGFATGGRRGELLKLRWMDCQLNSENPYAICIDTKNGKDKTIYFNAEIVAELKRFRGIGKAFVFRGVNGGTPYFRKSWISALKRAGIAELDSNGERLGFHSTRHTFCTDLINANVDVSIVQILAGHSNITTTQRYIHPNEDKKLEALKTFENIGVINYV